MSSSLVTEADLPQSLSSLVQKADAAILSQNVGYAVQLLLPVVKAEPNYLDGRRKLRKASAANKKGTAAPKKLFGGLGGGGFSNMKLQGVVKKEPASALPELEDLLVDDPYNPQVNGMLYEAAIALDMPETAAFALETIREGHPADTKNMHRLAQHYLLNKEPEKAANIFAAILRVDNTDGEARKGVTNANAQASITRQGWGQRESVRDLLKSKEQAKSLEDDSRKGMTADQLDARLAEWGEKYNEDPQNINVVKKIADLYEQKEDLVSALQWYDYAFGLNTADTALASKVQQLRDRVDDQHFATLKAELEANPDAPDAAHKRVEFEELLAARRTRQIASTKDRVEKNPTDLQLRFEYGAALLAGGQLSEAIAELQKAKNNPNIRNRSTLMLARCYEQKGIYDLALRQLNECAQELLGMDATKKEVLYAKGLIHEKLGQKEAALDDFKQIYEVDYGYLDVAQRVESSYS
jgi:tetratricopeptide (TPR) repeat protein